MLTDNKITIKGGDKNIVIKNAQIHLNRLFPMPVMLFFKYANKLTFSIINRRPNKIDSSKDVVEKVTLIKDIDIENPKRSHIEILNDLSMNNLFPKDTPHNFNELHEAWRRVLNISELNKRFYKDLSNWYFWALDKTEFPKDAETDENGNYPISIIRMITRLIFVWFMKERQLVPEQLFDENKIKDILKNTDKTLGSKKLKNENANGIINILNNYKFTIEESTPLEEEIALDPELLGKVFENLLASFNPETKTTARKLTGSFYTPREIVDYMVDESIIAHLKTNLDLTGFQNLSGQNLSGLEESLRDLLSYKQIENPFSDSETDEIIKSINTMKILDPACGSGAISTK